MCRRTATKDPLRQPPKTRRRDKSQENCLQDICLCLLYTSYLKILCRSHVSDSCRSVHQYGSSTRSTVSTSLCLRLLCKIHVSGFMSQHPCVSQDPLQDPCLRIHVSDSCLSIHQYGSSARSMSPGSCLSIQMYLRNLCKIHVSGSVCKHPYVSQDPLQDPRLRFMSQHLCISGSSARSMSSDSCLSIFESQDPLQDPRVRFMS